MKPKVVTKCYEIGKKGDVGNYRGGFERSQSKGLLNMEMNNIVLRSHQSQNKSVINFVINQPDVSNGKNYEMEYNNYKCKPLIKKTVEKFLNILDLFIREIENRMASGFVFDKDTPVDGYNVLKTYNHEMFDSGNHGDTGYSNFSKNNNLTKIKTHGTGFLDKVKDERNKINRLKSRLSHNSRDN